MFRNRQSSQKPSDELFERFRQSFPGVRVGSTGAANDSQTITSLDGSTLNQPRFGHEHEDLDPTPRAPSEPFRFTPSLLDPNSSAFAAFANQPPPGLFTPTPGGGSTLYNSHSHHDLQTPNIGISIGTPLSMPNTATAMPRPTASDDDYSAQTIQPHQFQNYQPFTQSLHAGYLDPSQFHPRPPSGPGSPMDVGETADGLEAGPLDGPQMDSSALMSLEGKQYDHELAPVSSAERFRFHVVLNAPTAMIKHPDEIPVTYLNKGQAYAISILDTNPPAPSTLTGPIRYRTYIRISFHDETQRSRPASCWQLWKEGRGANEAHQRGGKLQAVEYVDPSSPKEDDKKARVEIEAASFDSFVVIWSPGTSGVAETSVSVRFNFLSTDFSHSKGVKGIPVRLCAKTEVISSGSPHSPVDKPEVCFCKVKLFRDHGAERKLANDILHVKKTIEKLRQQANQVEGTGMKIFGKKNKKEEEVSGRPGKVPRHKRTWSMSSASSVGGGRSQEEDTNAKLAGLQDMFTSTRAVSVLYLRGSDLDDPDINPVHLPGEAPELTDDIWARRRSSVATTNTTASSFVSPTPSSASLSSQHGDGFSSPERREWERGFQPLPPPQQNNIGSEIPIRVKTNNDTGMLSGWIEAIGIDSTYIPPVEKASKAVMSIYILPTALGSPQNGQIYRAVYLQARTAQCLTSSIAAKCGIDPATVLRTVHMSNRGLSIFVDDEFVREMAEGQDMKVQAVEIREESPFASPPQEWANSPEESQDGEGNLKNGAPHGWELRLLY